MTELSPEARAIAGAGARDDGPTGTDRERVRKALMATIAGGATAASTGSASAATTSASTTAAAATAGASVTTKLLIAVAVGLGAGTGIYLAQGDAPEPAVVTPAPTPPPTPAPTPAVSPSQSPSPSPSTVDRDRDRDRDEPQPPTQTPTPTRPPIADLAREQQLLRAAARAMRAGAPAHALSLLDEHAASFPDGQLEPERAATRVHVLCDRAEDARAAADSFRRRHPRSPLLPRIDRSCARPAADPPTHP
jgi:hypothetical protein